MNSKKVVFYIPVSKNNKSSWRGLWRNDKGKIYYDYIEPCEKIYHAFNCRHASRDYALYLCQRYRQEAIFYIANGKAHILSADNELLRLKKLHTIRTCKENLKKNLKYFLKIYGAVTIKKSQKYFILEAWY